MNTIKNAKTCFDLGCTSGPKYLAEAPDGKQIPVCYKHSLQFPAAKVIEQ